MLVHKGLDKLEKFGFGQRLGEYVGRKFVGTHVADRNDPQFNLLPCKVVGNGHVFVSLVVNGVVVHGDGAAAIVEEIDWSNSTW